MNRLQKPYEDNLTKKRPEHQTAFLPVLELPA